MMRRLTVRLMVVPVVLLVAVVSSGSIARSAELGRGSTFVHPATVECPWGAKGGDQISRGFYVSDYPARTIHNITLRYSGSGAVNLTLTAHRWRFDGPVIAASTLRVVFPARGARKVVYPFDDVAVRRGIRIAFTQRASGDGTIFYNVGPGPLGDETYDGCPGVVETQGTAPPLSKFRRASVGVIIRRA